MEIVIAGAGSIGLLIGSYLAEAGWEVTFFVRREEQASLIRRTGISRLDGSGNERTFIAAAETDGEKLPKKAPWIVAVKYGGIAAILEAAEKLNMQNGLLFVQNGIGHFNQALKTDLTPLFFASVEHGAGRLDDRTVSHNGVGKMKIAFYRGDKKRFDELKLIRSEAFPIEFVKDAQEIVFRKALINCMINPLTAILGIRNGELLENPHAKWLFDELYNEIMAAFPEMQTNLPKEAVEAICVNTSINLSSMLKDRMEGNPMEIGTIVTAVLEMAHQRNSLLPLLSSFEKMLNVLDGRETVW